MPRGFADLSKEGRRKLGAKGGKIAQEAGVGHRLDKVSAKAAAAKSVAARKHKFARAAALNLLEAGIQPEQLHALQLSEDEMIYYGGSGRSGIKFKELLGRIADADRQRKISEAAADIQFPTE